MDIDTLQIEIESASGEAVSGIDKLAESLGRLRSAAKGGAGLTTVTRQLQALNKAANQINNSGLKELSESLNSLKNSSGAAAALNSAARTARSAKVDYSSLSTEVLATAKQFAALPTSVQASANALSRAKSALNGLSGTKTAVSLDEAAVSLETLKQSASSVNSVMERSKTTLLGNTSAAKAVGAAYAELPPQIQKAISANAALEASGKKVSKSFGILGTGISFSTAKFGIYSAVFRRIANSMSDWVSESNDYVENLNLFTVAMGEYAGEAFNYAEQVRDALGIDPSEFMRNQGIFKQITSGFGVVAEKADLMSKNLTQIGYDISSFFNISIEEAMEKVQSGIAGELEPLRRLGYALDIATLQQVAYNHGITQSINTMTQAQKSQLRYVAIMEQSGNVMGDMARTVQTPANAMRILNQQITQLGRALGNLLIPFLQQVIPWVQAFVELLTEAIQRLAVLVGFELPSIDYSGMNGLASGAEEAEEALSGAAGAAKELKNATIGIDELNVISPNTGGGGGSGASMGGDLGLELPEYDFLGDIQGKTNEIKEKLRPFFDFLDNNLESIAETVATIGAGMLLWKITSSLINKAGKLLDAFKKTGKEIKGIDKALRVAAGITIAITGFTIAYQGSFEIGRGTAGLMDYIKTAVGSAMGIAGTTLGLTTMGLPFGAAIGISIGLALIVNLVAYFQGEHQALVDKFYASDMGKQLTELKEEIESKSDILVDLKARINSITGEIDETTQLKLDSAQQLINEIFEMDASDNKTASELAVIQQKIETLNGLGLEGIQLSFDETTGKVKETKDEIQGVLDAIKQQYALEANKQAYIDAYIAQNDAITNLKDSVATAASTQALYEEALSKSAIAQNNLNEAQSKMQEYMDSEAGQSPAGMMSDEYNNLYDSLRNAEQAFEYAKVAVDETGTEFNNAMEQVQGFYEASEEAEKVIKNLDEQLASLTGTLDGKDQDFANAGTNLMEGLKSGILESSDIPSNEVLNVAENMLSEFREFNDINSPAGLYEDQALYIMEGIGNGLKNGTELITEAMNTSMSELLKSERDFNFSESGDGLYYTEAKGIMNDFSSGITENMTIVTVAMDTLLNALLSKMETFSNRCRNALNEMLTDFASAMASVNISSGGNVSFGRIKTVSIPRFANGGFPDQGQMFVANEAGPELVGRIGTRTAVANTDQIVTAISRAVYEAMTEAQSNQQQQPIVVDSNVYLDSKPIAASVEKRQRERGVSIMPGGVMDL